MEPEIIDKPAFTVIGLGCCTRNKNNEIPDLWVEFWPRIDEVPNKVESDISYGVVGNFDEESGRFDYLAGFEVDKGTEVPAGLSSWDVPAQRYVVFATTLSKLMETIHYAYNTWLPESAYEHAGGPELEIYGDEFDPVDPESIMHYCIPIE